MSLKWFPDVSAGAFDDSRVEVVIADGVKYVAETKERFDAIIVDSTDPQGPGVVLFTRAFYASCRRCLKPGGVLVTQNGVPFMQPDELKSSVGHFRALFADGRCYLATIPTYVGGPMAMGWASDDARRWQVPAATLQKRFKESGATTRYYTPDVHRAAFALPAYVSALVG
jgi:spermidine synthase